MKLIYNESKNILVTAYTFTDEDIANALIEASRRGVGVELVVDIGQVWDSFNMWKLVRRLVNNNISAWIYDSKDGIMHNKFIVFQDNAYRNSSLVWTGSFNLTQLANNKNRENVVLFNEAPLIKTFKDEFNMLKAQSIKELPPISCVLCPKCKVRKLRVDAIPRRNKVISCINCCFSHPYINK